MRHNAHEDARARRHAMLRRALVLSLLLVPMAAAAVGPSSVSPPTTQGNDGSAPGPQESLEDGAGKAWFGALLVGSMFLGALLLVLLLRQDRLDRRRRP